eukprot:TRINITY_DN20025_c0_g1_i1.p1 TRINITY_DN20025_c0_g1~~TRINITY_DN20025_c0_g1_i1.p1  ORF type:complete len:284 (-),score=38.23 TRINITY_DN20025_c0_g1_i1:360-1211(-)
MEENSNKKIKVFVLGDQCLLFDVEGFKKLRTEHRIAGSLIGQLSDFKQQTIYSGLPVAFGMEEVYVCLENGWIELRQGRNLSSMAQQLSHHKKRRRYDDGDDNSDGYYEDKQRKQQKAKNVDASTNGSVKQNEQDESKMEDVDESWKELLLNGKYVEVLLADEGEPAQWNFPSTKQQAMNCAVFRDLHKKGYYLTNGLRFGSQFLVYPGDPSVFHSQFSVKIVEEDTEIFSPIQLAAMMRGTHQARKHLLWACLKLKDDGNDLKVEDYNINYITIAPISGFAP